MKAFILFVFIILVMPSPVHASGGPPSVEDLAATPPSPEEQETVHAQLAACSRGYGGAPSASEEAVLALIRLETMLGVPRQARGLLSAVWCWETAFSTRPPVGDQGRSHGPMQMMGWLWAWCGHPIGWRDGRVLPARRLHAITHNVTIAASCFWRRVEHYLADNACNRNVWRAEAMTAHAPKYAPAGCGARSLHAEELSRWPAPARRAF